MGKLSSRKVVSTRIFSAIRKPPFYNYQNFTIINLDHLNPLLVHHILNLRVSISLQFVNSSYLELCHLRNSALLSQWLSFGGAALPMVQIR